MGNANICADTPINWICNDVTVKPSQKMDLSEPRKSNTIEEQPQAIKGINQ